MGMVSPRAVVRDVFPLNENAKVMSLLILVLGVSPMLAPTVGSYVIATFGWNYVFALLAIVAVLMMTAVFFGLPESKQPDPTFSLKVGPILSSYARVLKEPQFYTYALAGSVSSGGLFAYVSGSPLVFMTYFNASEKMYGAIFAFISVGLITCSQINSILLRRYSSKQLMRTMLTVQLIIGVFLVIGSVLNVLGLYGTVLGIFCFLSCQGFSFPNSAALSMAPFTREAGSASALMGAMQMALGSLAAASVALLNAKTPVPLSTVMASCTALGLLILYVGTKRIGKREVVI